MLEKSTPADFDPDARTLETWALQSEPIVGAKINAKRLEDHRARYLDEEGPLSNNRGRVSRLLEGEFEWLPVENTFSERRLRLKNPPWQLNI